MRSVSAAAASSAPAASAAAAALRCMSTAPPASSGHPVGKLVRSSTTGLRATIFGAYGFVGRYVTALLGT